METPQRQPTTTKATSPPRDPLSRVPVEGLIAFCLNNSHNAYVIPSTKNYISCDATNLRFQINHVKLDIGATKSLWYFRSVDCLKEFFLNAPSIEGLELNGHLFTIKTGTSQGGTVVTLKCVHADNYSIYLGTDIIPNPIPLSVESIQFHLCTEDIQYILNSENESVIKIPETVRMTLQTHLTNLGDTVIKRRGWSLLGNDVIKQIGMIKIQHTVLLCKRDTFLLSSWIALVVLETKILSMEYLHLPSTENDELNAITDETNLDSDFDYWDFIE